MTPTTNKQQHVQEMNPKFQTSKNIQWIHKLQKLTNDEEMWVRPSAVGCPGGEQRFEIKNWTRIVFVQEPDQTRTWEPRFFQDRTIPDWTTTLLVWRSQGRGGGQRGERAGERVGEGRGRDGEREGVGEYTPKYSHILHNPNLPHISIYISHILPFQY